jgi:hypothetical protein
MREGAIEMNRECSNGHVPRTCAAGLATARRLIVAALVFVSPSVAFAADYQVGQVIVYDNPNDDIPARKGRVTKIVGDQVWVDFGAFDPTLNAADASKILFKKTDQLDSWTHAEGAKTDAVVTPGAQVPAAPAAAGGYQVGQVIVYDNPNDSVPPRKGRVTKLSGDQVWVNFGEFDPSLNAGDAAKVLFKGTNELDDWTRPDGPGKGANVVPDANAPAPAAAPDANAPAPAVAPGAAPDQTAANVADAGTLASLFGLWSTLQIGHTVIVAPGDGYIYQKQEIADKAGAIAINPDGTYLWNSVSEGVIKGTWREASAAEVKAGYDGPGIRLIHAEGGWDYNVQLRPQNGTQAAASIIIWTQGYQVNAYRME